AVYRAPAQLQRDNLVEASAQNPKAGLARRVYRMPPQGERALRVWMGVVKEEYGRLGEVLRRYQATGTTDAILAEVEGGWSIALGSGWSPVSSTSAGRRLVSLDSGPEASTLVPPDLTADRSPGFAEAPCPEPQRFRLIP